MGGRDGVRARRRLFPLIVNAAYRPSIDYGRSTYFQVHRIAAARNVPGLENLTNSISFRLAARC